jgi:hypothetical protein
MALIGLLAFTFRPAIGQEPQFDLSDEEVSGATEMEEVDDLPETSEGAPEELDSTTVVLRENGDFAGRVRLVWPTGKMEPADAAVTILRGEEAVGETRTSENGQFQLAGLEPGDYVARATIAEGSKDFQVAVLPHRTDATPSEMYFDATLTPLPNMVDGAILTDSCGGCGVCDDCLATEIVAEEVPLEQCGPPMPCMMGAPCGTSCGGGFAGGGCCGAGWLPLAGLAGLAGLAALADDDDGQVVVSPNTIIQQ